MAALFVVIHHLRGSYSLHALPGVTGVLTNGLLYGHLWVDVFIVLSGACLMLPVARSRSFRGAGQFYLRRAWRILPPFWATVALAYALMAFKGTALPPYTLPANLLLLQDLLPRLNVLDGALWSVALEWKIYFLFPLLVWLWLRFGSPAVLLASAGIGYGLLGLLTVVYPSLFLEHSCPWYVFLFGMGMAATDFAVRPAPPRSPKLLPALFWGAAACLALLLCKWPITAAGDALYVRHLPIIDAAVGAVTALALIWLGWKAAGKEPSFPLALLSWKPLVFVGTFGYSLYLIHSLIVYRLQVLLADRLHLRFPLIVCVLDIAVTLGLAYGFHLIFERPFMSKPGTMGPKHEREAEAAAIESPAP